MGIQKQEFYEGAALHQLIRSGGDIDISYSSPLFVIQKKFQVHLKYSTKIRSPWGFSFLPDEQEVITSRATQLPLIIGLICGSDGVAALPYDDYKQIAIVSKSAVWISCARLHRAYFEVSGPDATVKRKIAPSEWSGLTKIKTNGAKNETLRSSAATIT